MTTDLILQQRASLAEKTARRELAVATWLAEKAGLSHSRETRRAYSATLQRFRQMLADRGWDLETDYRLLVPIAQAFAEAKVFHRATMRQESPRASTHNRRLAILSSFYRHAIERGLLEPPNPIDKVARQRHQVYRNARALDADRALDALAAIDTAALVGARDHALLLVALMTGRRVSELAGLRFGDLELTRDGELRLQWQRTKGDGSHADLLPPETSAVILAYLAQAYGEETPPPPESAVWVSVSRRNPGRPISSQTIADICQRHLKISQVHRLRHTFAKMMEEDGATISVIQSRLGHKSAATTAIYLQALKREKNPHGGALQRRLGIKHPNPPIQT